MPFFIIATQFLTSTANATDAINIKQAKAEAKYITVIEDPELEFIANRLLPLPEFEIYNGSCDVISKQIRRQVACLSSKNDNILLKIPKSISTANVITIPNSIFNAKNNIKAEIKLSERIFKSITGESSSIFSTTLAYISKNNNGKYSLRVSNYDGSESKTLHESFEPLLSPSWSPDGRYITYVSYERIRASIMVQDTKTKKRINVLTLKGLNAYPSFKDEETLYVSLSNEKENSEIYSYNILNKKLTLLKQAKIADIFPRKINSNSYAKVGLAANNAPYAYEVINGKQNPISILPLNAIDSSNVESIVGLSGTKLVLIKKQDDKWGEMKTLISNAKIESPTISANGQIIYYSIKEKNKVFVKGTLNTGENILSFMINNEDLIQVSAL